MPGSAPGPVPRQRAGRKPLVLPPSDTQPIEYVSGIRALIPKKNHRRATQEKDAIHVTPEQDIGRSCRPAREDGVPGTKKAAFNVR